MFAIGVSDSDLASRIRKDGIDVLVDLASVRTSLRQVIADSPICDAKGFSTAVEQAQVFLA